jgi:polysaccharide biosynthesis protein PslA
MLLDVLVLSLAGVMPALVYDPVGTGALGHLLNVIGAALLLFLLTTRALSAYDTAHNFEWPRVIPRAILSLLLTFFVLMVIGVATKTIEDYSRVWFFSWISLSLVLIVSSRAVLLAVVEAKLARGACLQRALIITCGESALTGDQLALETRNRVRAVGTIATDDLSSIPDLGPFLRQHSPEIVVLSLPWSQVEAAMTKLRALSHHAIEVLVLPQASTGLEKALRLRRLGSQTLLQIAEPPLAEWDRAAKRAEDIIIAGLALFLLLPLLVLTALAIKLDSRGPILFKQKRAGFNGALIEVWKFRSMYVDAADLHASRQTSKDDPRVTRVGRFIRRTSLDELPQLWNVLQGQMSLVGPRPHALATSAEGQSLDMIVEEYAARHRVKPGITGWAQVNGARGELTSREQVQRRVNYDLHYIDNWSVLFDLKIILMTAVRVLYDPDAY